MATYKRQRYLLMSTDPVHIGTGGYRLGRVDNSIVREPGTRVPKIPGTALSGAIRSYAASQYGSLSCAGQKGHCGKSTCPICYTFGCLQETEEGTEKKTVAFSGVVNLFDAHVLLFPVHSMAGPVWVSTPQRLKNAGFTVNGVPKDEEWKAEQVLFTWERKYALNLGWLMLDAGPQVTVEAPQRKWQDAERWQAVKDHVVLVKENLFGQVVNSNLEVRTSVSIDPERGAAEEGALFTYEALPCATFLVGEVVLDDYRDGQTTKDGNPLKRPFPVSKRKDDSDLPSGPWEDPLDVVMAGLGMTQWLGIGGMGTRGFGRLAVIGEPLKQNWGEEVWK
jgi:CRISPR-associated protein Cmr4